MKKIFIIIFLIVDIGVLAGSVYFLFNYVKTKMSVVASSTAAAPAATPAPATPATPVSTSTPKGLGSGFLATPTLSESSIRKILFSYKNSKAKVVAIRADFTGWKAEPMLKAEGGKWTYQAQLAPGEYAYCYTVDDKTFKDPANKRTKLIGRTTVSAIIVEALSSKAAK